MRQQITAATTVLVAALLLGATFPPALRAQATGSITGTVTDAATMRPLDGARVELPGLEMGTLSNTAGGFELPEVPVGTHELRVQAFGYAGAVRTVTVTEGATVSVELRMEFETFGLRELVVTGTAFEESPTRLPYSVAVSGRRTLAEQGSPTAVDFFRNLGASAGVLGDRQGWYNTRPATAVSETTASVNLRGVGASRTLVLLNGRRQVYLPARLSGGRFVDVNAFPSIALDRIEVVKEGASAIYGSDAVAGVANFLTRGDFEGFEVSGAHEYYAGSGDTHAGAIWGAPLGENAHAVVSAEVAATQELGPAERDWALRPFVAGTGAWSYTGNPGAFLFPRLTGDETKEEFVAALSDAQFGGWGGVFVDPRCTDFGGHRENETCRFRYQPWDNLIQGSRHVRAFAEVNGTAGERSRYHVEALWAQAAIPQWVTTPSYPPISPYNGAQVIQPGHPGRRQFCQTHGQSAGFANQDACLGNDWYFYGRLVGNSGPSRIMERAGRTLRFAASLERDFEAFGGRSTSFELATSYSRATGNSNLPAEYAYRKFLAFRGFGGADCGVKVVVDASSPSGMALGPLGGAVAGEGNCEYYNPFSSAHQYSAQPGSSLEDKANPDYLPALANSAELLAWINEEVNLDNYAGLIVADAMLKGEMVEDVAEYAVGYQFRRLNVSADPNEPGDLSINPCPVLGDKSCLEKAGAFTFTTGHYSYEAAQTVNRFFLESRLQFGERVHAQAAANYEFHGSVSSFDPKVALRVQLAEPLALRASLQTTFRTPSADDLNEDRSTSLEYVNEAGIYKAVDTYGNSELTPERAFTYNVGFTMELARGRVALDYWNYDFRDVIDVLPRAGVTTLYSKGGASRDAVKHLITCPDGTGTGTCDVTAVERIKVTNVNWPGIEMSGIDFHASVRGPVGEAILSMGLDGTHVQEFVVKALDLNDATVSEEQDAAGKLNWNSPIAPPLPRLKLRLSAGYHVGDLSLGQLLQPCVGVHQRGVCGQQRRRTRHRSVPHLGPESASTHLRKRRCGPLRPERARHASPGGELGAVLRRLHPQPQGSAHQALDDVQDGELRGSPVQGDTIRRFPRVLVPVFLAALAGAALAGTLDAQATGTISGTVMDDAREEPLAGASVELPALGMRIRSGPGGHFTLATVPAGTHELRAGAFGHGHVVRSVTVVEGDTVFLALRLQPDAFHLHELVVTGTAFEESPTKLPYSVAVAGRRTLAERGSPTAVDFFRNLGASAGVLGDRQSWYTRPATAVSETVASVNLRGIGASRTLVLINGRRQVYLPVRMSGGRFVDVNAFPSIALDRIEVVKEGASAIYGSDAVAGVANFLTRGDFEGFEVSGAHEHFAGAGDTQVGWIWGGTLGEGAHLVVSAEAVVTQELDPRDRDWALRDFTPGGGSWSYTGNPGAFLFPRLTGNETKEDFVAALTDAQFGGWGGVFVDPRCKAFGGHVEDVTCRFRYQPWDNLLQGSRHLRAFAEANGTLGDRSRYHVEALWAEAAIPRWTTTPSFPPISPYNGAQVIEPGHPGRRQFCRTHGRSAGFADLGACLENDWYFYGRLVGNSGPGRFLQRAGRTLRVSASLERDFEAFGGRATSFGLGTAYSRATSNSNLPAEYAYRKFLAFRGFGGPDCGVGVVVDSSSPSGMALGPLNGAVAGQGGCMYYNPFSNAHRHSAQPGSTYNDQENPDHLPDLANGPELIGWINEEVNLDNYAGLVVADAMLKGELAEDLADYAIGYQFRWFDVSATPNRPGDLTINPCPVLGDKSCAERAGAFTFTTGHYPYEAAQTVSRFFAETAFRLGRRVQAQAAANYEFHGSLSSFDPKLAVRAELAEPLALRASLQTTFRTPSADDLNEDRSTSLEYVAEAGIYKAVDTYGNAQLTPERATTYNVGLTLELPRARAAVDYWSYDFGDVIDVIPHAGITRLYAAGGASRDAVKEFVTCPDGTGTGTCDAAAIERIRIANVNWPGVEMSGLDFHASTRQPAMGAIVSLEVDGTYVHEFVVKALDLNGATVFEEQDAAGKLNWNNPIAPSLPRLKLRLSAGHHIGDHSFVSHFNHVSGYTNEEFEGTEFEHIDRSFTWDLSVLRRTAGRTGAALSVLNVLGTPPPLVNWEQSYDGRTHSPKGRRFKLSVTYRMGN